MSFCFFNGLELTIKFSSNITNTSICSSLYNSKGYGPIVLDLCLFVNPNRVCLCRDSVHQLSHTTDFVIKISDTLLSSDRHIWIFGYRNKNWQNESHMLDYLLNKGWGTTGLYWKGLNLYLHVEHFLMEQYGTFVFTLWSQLTCVWRSFADKNMIDRLAALNTWESFSSLLIGAMLLLYWKTWIRYFTLPFIVQMEHFDTYSTHPAVHTIDTMSICMKKFGVEKPCLYEMVSVFTLSLFPACFLI